MTFRWLTLRALNWTALVCFCGLAVLLLVGWVEWASRWTGTGSVFLVALLETPERWVQLLPLMMALAGALFGIRLVSNGEWEGLSAIGLGIRSRVLPVCFVGLGIGVLGAFAGEHLVPEAERTRHNRVASAEGRPVVNSMGVWLRVEDVVFGVSDTDSGVRGRALRWRDGAVDGVWDASLRWDGARWVPAEVVGADSPWALLPSPETLSQIRQSERWSGHRWSELTTLKSTGAMAEQSMRLSRVLACMLASGGGFLLGVWAALRSSSVLWAVLPVALVELVSLSLQSAAAKGVLFFAVPAGVRVVLLMLLLSLSAVRVTRPH